MKATEQYFPVVLFIMLYKVVLTFESSDETVSVTIQMKATEQYFPVVLFITLYKVVLTSESVDETPWCEHLNETSLAALPHDTSSFFNVIQNEVRDYLRRAWKISHI